MDAPIAGDPHYHLHNFIPNLVVTDDGRIGSIDSKVLTAHKVHEYGAIFQARLADRLRALGVRVGLDADGEAIVGLDIPASAVATFSKRDRQVIGDAKAYAKDNAMDWDELSLERKKQLLHEASAAGRLGKTKDEARSVWREQAEAIGWSPKTVLAAAATPAREAADRHEKAYALAAEALSAEFQTPLTANGSAAAGGAPSSIAVRKGEAVSGAIGPVPGPFAFGPRSATCTVRSASYIPPPPTSMKEIGFGAPLSVTKSPPRGCNDAAATCRTFDPTVGAHT